MNVEFKVGDKFKSINDKLTHFTKGNVYEVEEVGELGNFHIAFKDDAGNVSWGSSKTLSEHFQRIDEPQPQVTKVKLTQEQATALESVMKDSDIEYIITAHATEGEWMPDEMRALNELSVADLARALLIGYEVEQTAEEKVLEVWVKRDPNDETIDEYEMMRHAGFRKGMKFTLDAYGIKVKGIND